MESKSISLSSEAYNKLSKLDNFIIKNILDKCPIIDIENTEQNEVVHLYDLNINEAIFKKGKIDRLKTIPFSIGKALGMICNILDLNVKSSELETVAAEIKSLFIKNEPDVITGEEIKYWYNLENYAYPGLYFDENSFKGHLSKSCMRYPEHENNFELYTKNPNKVSLVIVKNEKNKLLARALLWKTDSDKIILDRIYYSDMAELSFILNWANSKGYYYVDTITWKPDRNYAEAIHKTKSKIYNESVTLDNCDFNKFPYLDAFQWFDSQTQKLHMCSDDIASKLYYVRLRGTKGFISTDYVYNRVNIDSNTMLDKYMKNIPAVIRYTIYNFTPKDIIALLKKYPSASSKILLQRNIIDYHTLFNLILENKLYYALANLYFNGDEITVSNGEVIPSNTKYELNLLKDPCEEFLKRNISFLQILPKDKVVNILLSNIDLIIKNNISLLISKTFVKNSYRFFKHIDYLFTIINKQSQHQRHLSIDNYFNNINKVVDYASYITNFGETDEIVDEYISFLNLFYYKADTLTVIIKYVLSYREKPVYLKIIANQKWKNLITLIKKRYGDDYSIKTLYNDLTNYVEPKIKVEVENDTDNDFFEITEA